MKKVDFINAVAAACPSCTKKQVQAVIDAAFSAMTEALTADDSITLFGFGTFRVVKRAARMGRNPRTGEAMPIPASKNVKFTPGKTLKESLN